MGSAETKKLKKKEGKYSIGCPNKCFTPYSNQNKYSTSKLICKKCRTKLIRWQPDKSNTKHDYYDSDTPSEPLFDKDDPEKTIAIGKFDDTSESESETASPPSDFDKTAREEADDTKGNYDPSAPKEEDVDSTQLQSNSKQLYPKVSDVDKEVKFQEYMDNPDTQKAKGALRKNPPSRTTENQAQLPSMKDDRLDRFLFDVDKGHESDDDDTDNERQESRPLTPLQEAMTNNMYKLEDDINLIDDQIKVSQAIIELLPNGDEKAKELAIMRDLLGQKREANRKQRDQSGEIAKLASTHQIEAAKIGRKQSRHNDALRHIGIKGRDKSKKAAQKFGVISIKHNKTKNSGKGDPSSSSSSSSEDETLHAAKNDSAGKRDNKMNGQGKNTQRPHESYVGNNGDQPDDPSNPSSSSSDPTSGDDGDKSRKKKKKKDKKEKKEPKKKDTAIPSPPGSNNDSQASSVFRSGPERIIAKLKETITYCKDVIKNHSNSRTRNEKATKMVQESIKFAEIQGGKMISKGQFPQQHQEEEIEDLIKDLKKLEGQVDDNLERIGQEEALKRAQARSKDPTWDGTAMLYREFSEAIDIATRYKSDGDKRIALKHAIDNSAGKRDEILGHLKFCTTYSEMKKELDSIFTKITSILPGEWDKVKRLPQAKGYEYQVENDNIMVIVNYYNFLVAHDMAHKFEILSFYEAISKIRPLNKYQVKSEQDKYEQDWSLFIKKLKFFYNQNLEELGLLSKGLFAEGKQVGQSQTPKSRDQTSRAGILKYDTEQGGNKSPSCNFCKGEHLTYLCPTLRSADSDQCVKLLTAKQICIKCLRRCDKGECKTNFQDSKSGKEFSTICPTPCESGLNKAICCQRPSMNKQDRTDPSAATLTAGTSKEKEVTVLNAVPVGATASLVETVQCIVEGVGPVNIGVLYDQGAQSTLISSSLRPFVTNFKKGIFWIDTVSGSKRIEAGTGRIVLKTKNGPLSIHGIVKPLSNPFTSSHRIKIPHIWQKLYKVPSEYSLNNFMYQIILGSDALEHYPKEIIANKGLVLSQSRLTDKVLISGYNKDQCMEAGSYVSNKMSIMKSSVRNALDTESLLNVHPIFKGNLNQIDANMIARLTPDQDFVQKAKCEECRDRSFCTSCRLDLNTQTKLQSNETKLLTESLSYCEEVERYTYKGVYKKNIIDVPSYYTETTKRMEQLVRKLKRNPNGSSIASEMDRSILANVDSGVFAWQKDWVATNPTRKDLQYSYSPVSYALKREGTTKVRLVHDYSFQTANQPSLNDAQLCGSSGNHKIGHILLLHRCFQDYSVADIKKFYHCVCVSDQTAAMQQFLWKPGGILSEEPWQAIVPLRMMFGRRDAQCVCQAAKLQCAAKFLTDSPEALTWIQKSYTDDVCCASNDGRQSMMNVQGQIEAALGKGGFKLKDWVNAGSADEGNIEKLMSPSNISSSHLGIKWLPSTDEWACSFVLNLEKRQRGVKPVEQDLTSHQEVTNYVKTNGLTKRQALAITHILWDPLSLFLQQLTNGKILYRNLIASQPLLQWTDKIAASSLPQWERYLHQIIDIKNIKVPRCALPENWREGLSLCMSSDGSQSCSVGRAFLRSDKADASGMHPTTYLCGTSKLAETGVSAAIKSETNALLITCRMAEQIVVTLGGEPNIKFSNIFICTDSKALLSIVQMDPSRMKLWFISRLNEILHLINSLNIKIVFARSEFCDADGASKLQLDENFTLTNTYWKSKFFYKPQADWPIEATSDPDHELNEQIMNQIGNTRLHVMNTNVLEDGVISQLLSKFNNFEKISNTLAYIKCLLNKKDFASNKFDARNLLLNLAHPTEKQIEGLKKQFVVTQSDPDLPGTVLISREFTTDNQTVNFKYRAINGNTHIGKALINSLHKHVMSPVREHALALEKGYYIIGGRKLFKNLTKNCITCRKIRSYTVHPPAGQSLLLEAMKGDRYQIITIDVFGYLRAKVGRSIVKIYFLTTSCHKTLHVTFSVMLDNSAASLMSALQRTLHNVAATCHVCVSDSGTNIITIKDLGLNGTDEQIQINDVAAAMQASGITFRTSTSSPWRSTRAEKAHHLLKVALRRSGLAKNHSYSIEQWFHIASYMSRVLNDRPLTLSTIRDQLMTITPNKLIYGNSIGHLDVDLSPRAKLYDKLIQLEKDLAAWQNVFLNTYVKDQLNYLEKIQGTDAALEPGSVVLIKDHLNPVTKFPALGTITSVQSDRTYLVDYVKREPETKFEAGHLIVTRPALLGELQRPAQRLVLLFHPDKETETISEVTLDPILGQQQDTVEDTIAESVRSQRPSMKFITDDDTLFTIKDNVNRKRKEDTIAKPVRSQRPSMKFITDDDTLFTIKDNVNRKRK